MNAIVRGCGRLVAGIAIAFGAGTGQAQRPAQPQADVALVNQLSGEVRYAGEGQAATPVQPFMRVRQGDRFIVVSGASIRLVYFQGGRQETWRGPASFRAGTAAGESFGTTQPEVVNLPSAAPPKIARVPELLQAARLGGVSVRGAAKSAPVMLTLEQRAELAEARAVYRMLRNQAAADDITPELYLFAILHDFEQEDELRALLDELKRRAPDSQEVRELGAWLQGRSGGR